MRQLELLILHLMKFRYNEVRSLKARHEKIDEGYPGPLSWYVLYEAEEKA